VTKSAAAASHPNEHAIFIMNRDGSEQRQLTPWALAAGDFARFSPDGRRIIFRAGFGDGPGGDLYTIRPDGSGIKKLTHGLPGMLSAAYSPDGKYIAFAHEGPNGQMPDIWVMKADGTGATRLTHTPQWESLPTWGV
jgi:Tol biopolymer transport system component